MASAPPQPDGVSFFWRLETQQDADGRATAEAEADPVVRRKAAWAARYARLRLAHSMVCHTKKRGQKVQLAAIRRVLLHPDVAAALREAEADPFLQDCHTWRVAGTMKVDGYWTILRQRPGGLPFHRAWFYGAGSAGRGAGCPCSVQGACATAATSGASHQGQGGCWAGTPSSLPDCWPGHSKVQGEAQAPCGRRASKTTGSPTQRTAATADSPPRTPSRSRGSCGGKAPAWPA